MKNTSTLMIIQSKPRNQLNKRET